MNTPIVIGITGGIGAGKSTLLDAFVQRGATAFSADKAVHELYGSPEVIDAVVSRWGRDVLDQEGRIQRAKIAQIVFTNPEERVWLEQLLHPLVGIAWDEFVDERSQLPKPPEFIVAEVPLLFEAGLEDRYDAVVAITAPLEQRLERVAARGDGRSLPRERSDAQMDQGEKAERSDFAYQNTGTLEEIGAFADQVMQAMRKRKSALSGA